MHPDLVATVTRLLGSPPRDSTRATGGYTNNERWVVELEDGRTAFVKGAVDEDTAGWLRAEQNVYAQVQAKWLPALLAFDDDEVRPTLVLEDLSRERWPPPWTPADVDVVRHTLGDMWAHPPPEGLPRLEELREGWVGWSDVAEDPTPFLSLMLCSALWLERALPQLIHAEASFRLEGDSLVHVDLRSDNLCLRGDAAILIDWNQACVGNPEFDVAFWVPSLQSEGGPAPEALLGSDAGPAAAFVSGFFACRAGLPPIPHAPRVRDVQSAQLETALPWAVRALNLPPLDGQANPMSGATS
jgi:hypothetical protein